MSTGHPVVDSHIHYFPKAYYDFLAQRTEDPRAEFIDGHWAYINEKRFLRPAKPEWFDLETQFETAARTGFDTTLISSLGVHSDLDGLPKDAAIEAARMINEDWAAAQRRYPGRFFAAAAVPLVDTSAAIEELDYAVTQLDLRAVSVPSSVFGEPLDSERLEPFYARLEEIGIPAFIHPVDFVLVEALSGYNGRLHASLGRVVDSSVAVLRLILSGVFDRHPGLKVLHFHAGGVLPYAAGRLDKNASIPGIERQPTSYLKQMWVDTAMPYDLAIGLAIKFYGEDRVLYGSDNPCWNPRAALDATSSLSLEEETMRDVMHNNAHSLLNLRVPQTVGSDA